MGFNLGAFVQGGVGGYKTGEDFKYRSDMAKVLEKHLGGDKSSVAGGAEMSAEIAKQAQFSANPTGTFNGMDKMATPSLADAAQGAAPIADATPTAPAVDTGENMGPNYDQITRPPNTGAPAPALKNNVKPRGR